MQSASFNNGMELTPYSVRCAPASGAARSQRSGPCPRSCTALAPRAMLGRLPHWCRHTPRPSWRTSRPAVQRGPTRAPAGGCTRTLFSGVLWQVQPLHASVRVHTPSKACRPAGAVGAPGSVAPRALVQKKACRMPIRFFSPCTEDLFLRGLKLGRQNPLSSLKPTEACSRGGAD